MVDKVLLNYQDSTRHHIRNNIVVNNNHPHRHSNTPYSVLAAMSRGCAGDGPEGANDTATMDNNSDICLLVLPLGKYHAVTLFCISAHFCCILMYNASIMIIISNISLYNNIGAIL